ncbi:molybdate-binding periplasmic protein [Flavobacteriaceae bacterium UJ101]|nr:molybdate-binding periplasmic protein [Flavobacteriaceae bacterium UJ101]
MKKIIWTLFICFIFLSCHQKQEEKLNIAVAANMQFAMKELVKTFTQETEISCELIISSSGKLTAQIKEGAPFDVFVSANMKYPTELFETGYTIEKPQVYAYGKLVLWSMFDHITPSIELLRSPEVRHIVLANPKMAPYGAASMEVINHYNMNTELQDKLVFGESIAQTNQFIISKSAEVGFTAKSVVLASKLKNQGHWIDIDDIYTPIAQGVVIIKQQNNLQPQAEKFYHFLFSNTAQKILQNYGYATIQN